LRAGMGCEAQIVVQQLADVLYIPVQAVVRVGDEPTVYVRQPDGTFQPRTVEAGLDNETMIHIKSGLEAGEEVWLAPPLDVAKKEDESGRAAQSKLLLKKRAPQATESAPNGAAGKPATPSKPKRPKRRKPSGKKPAAPSK
jgi:HlyD family secretion protein